MTDKLVTEALELLGLQENSGFARNMSSAEKAGLLRVLTQLAEGAYKLALEDERKRCTAECRFYKESADLKAEGE